jgi:hypothetical protein
MSQSKMTIFFANSSPRVHRHPPRRAQQSPHALLVLATLRAIEDMLIGEREADLRVLQAVDVQLAEHRHAHAVQEAQLRARLQHQLGAGQHQDVVGHLVALRGQCGHARVQQAAEGHGVGDGEVGGWPQVTARLVEPQPLVAAVRVVDELRQVGPFCERERRGVNYPTRYGMFFFLLDFL